MSRNILPLEGLKPPQKNWPSYAYDETYCQYQSHEKGQFGHDYHTKARVLRDGAGIR